MPVHFSYVANTLEQTVSPEPVVVIALYTVCGNLCIVYRLTEAKPASGPTSWPIPQLS